MGEANTRKDAILPWEKSKSDGYGKLDLHIDLGEMGKVEVRRQRPNEDNPGKFSVYLNDAAVTGRAHFMRPEAVAEAERILYTSDQFRDSKPALALNATIKHGRDDFMNGVSAFACPIGADKPVSRQHWLSGWLEAYANSIIDPLKVGIGQTTRAFNQLQSDYETVSAKMMAFGNILTFAGTLEDDKQLRHFLTLANAGEVDKLRAEFPTLFPAAKSPDAPYTEAELNGQ